MDEYSTSKNDKTINKVSLLKKVWMKKIYLNLFKNIKIITFK